MNRSTDWSGRLTEEGDKKPAVTFIWLCLRGADGIYEYNIDGSLLTEAFWEESKANNERSYNPIWTQWITILTARRFLASPRHEARSVMGLNRGAE